MGQDEIEDFTPDDLPHLNLAMRAFPQAAHGFRSVITVLSKLSFPLSSPEDIAIAIGENQKLCYGDSEIAVDELPQLMPAYYFPIESAEDFVAKVADVCDRVREPDGRNIASTLMEACAPKPDHSPPEYGVKEMIRLAGLDHEVEAPSAGGLRQRAAD